MKKRRVAQFRIDSFQRTDQGALKVRANLTKTGVFPYQFQDGTTIREYRSPEEVFNQRAMDSLHGCPVTVLHPPEFVTTGNWNFHSVGTVISVEKDDPYLSGTLLIHDQRTIQRIEADELRELSCGYTADIVPAPAGTEHYDAAQVSIFYNHAAIGPEHFGRLGTDVGIRLDSNQELVLPQNYIMPDKKPAEEAVSQETEAVEDSTESTGETPSSAESVEEFDAKASYQALSAKVDTILERLDTKDQPKEDEDDEEEDEDKEKMDSSSTDVETLVEERANLKVAVRDSFEILCPGVSSQGKSIMELCTEGLKAVGHEAEGFEEKALIGMLQVAAKSASTATEKAEKTQKTDSEPSFAEQLLKNTSTAPEEKSFADSLVESVN